jgi:hypothetical protein
MCVHKYMYIYTYMCVYTYTPNQSRIMIKPVLLGIHQGLSSDLHHRTCCQREECRSWQCWDVSTLGVTTPL